MTFLKQIKKDWNTKKSGIMFRFSYFYQKTDEKDP